MCGLAQAETWPVIAGYWSPPAIWTRRREPEYGPAAFAIQANVKIFCAVGDGARPGFPLLRLLMKNG